MQMSMYISGGTMSGLNFLVLFHIFSFLQAQIFIIKYFKIHIKGEGKFYKDKMLVMKNNKEHT